MKSIAFNFLIGASCLAFMLCGAHAAPAINAVPMKTGVQRFAEIAEVKPDMADQCRALFSKPPQGAVDAMKSARLRNCSVYLEKIAPPSGDSSAGQFILFNYLEYSGRNFQADMSKLSTAKPYALWHKACDSCLTLNAGAQSPAWIDGEPVFFTAGAAGVVPTPPKYARAGMMTGLKPEKEAEYRTLHATAWPGVLKGIADSNLRNFGIYLCELDGKLYLFGYLEYVGAHKAADDAKAAALPVNKRWWKYTNTCQEPLPDAAAKHQTWSGMEELWHLD